MTGVCYNNDGGGAYNVDREFYYDTDGEGVIMMTGGRRDNNDGGDVIKMTWDRVV